MQRCPCIKSNPILHWANAIRGTALLRQLDNELWREFTLVCSAQIARDSSCHWRGWTAIQVIREYEDSQGKKVSLRKQKCTVRVIQLHSSAQANESIVCTVGNFVYCLTFESQTGRKTTVKNLQIYCCQIRGLQQPTLLQNRRKL